MNESMFLLAQSVDGSQSSLLVIGGIVCCGALAVLAMFFFWGIGVYNGLIGLRNQVKNAFSQIDVQLKRRYDLIPNLVETVKGYMGHEKGTLEAVISARAAAFNANKAAAADPTNPEAMKSLSAAESNLGGALGRLMVVFENYPELKANQNVMQLQEELTSTENKISFARQAYNDVVMKYNTHREVFPANLIAGLCGFLPSTEFVIENPAEKEAPKVKF